MTDKIWDSLVDKALHQAARRGAAEYLLREWLDLHDSDLCHFDHHGYCQAHYLQDKDDCIVARTRTYLREIDE